VSNAVRRGEKGKEKDKEMKKEIRRREGGGQRMEE